MISLFLLLILIIVLIVIIRDYRHLHKVNPTKDILFAKNPDEKHLSLMIADAYPIVVLDKLNDNISIKDISKIIPKTVVKYSYKSKPGDKTIYLKDLEKNIDDMLLLKDTKIVRDLKIDKIVYNIINLFNRPLTYYPKANIYSHIVSKDTRIPLRKNTNDTNVIIVMNGNIRIFMVSPLYQKNMYESNNTSPINMWDPDMKKFPLYKSVKISSDNIYEKEFIYIPPNWWYAILSPVNSFMIQIQRDNILSSIKN